MLGCDVFAVMCMIIVFALFRANRLAVWHLYVLNVISGLMNTIRQPASEAAMTLIIPDKYYRALISILNPLIATALYSFTGLNGVIVVDVGSFAVAFAALLFFIRIPENKNDKRERVFLSGAIISPLYMFVLFIYNQ